MYRLTNYLLILVALLGLQDARSQWQSLGTINADVRSIYFTSRDSGFAVGGDDIFRTVNGGSSWSSYGVKNSTGVFGLHFLNALTGYAVGDGVYKTSDGGDSWVRVNRDTLPDFGGFNVHFANELSGVIQGTNIFITSDGGQSWEKILEPNNPSGVARTMLFVNDSVGYLGGYVYGAFLYGAYSITADNGRTWARTPVLSPGIAGLEIEALYADSTKICVAGRKGTQSGMYGNKRLLINRRNAGWDTTGYIFPNTIVKVLFVDELNGYVGDEVGNIYSTKDAGYTWANDDVPTNGKPVYAIHAANGNVYAAAEQRLFKKSLATTVGVHNASVYSVSPNPSSGIVRVMLGSEFGDAKTAITVIDALGRMVYQTSTSHNTLHLDLSAFSKGMYYLTVCDHDSRYVTPISLY